MNEVPDIPDFLRRPPTAQHKEAIVARRRKADNGAESEAALDTEFGEAEAE